MMRGTMLLVSLLACCLPMCCRSMCATAYSAPGDEAWDWDQWRRLPVLDGGRQKPLDTLARETLFAIAHRRSFQDPATRERLEPVAWYLMMLFDWEAGSVAADPHLAGLGESPNAYFLLHQADRWDRLSMFRIDDLALRAALGCPPNVADRSALQLCQATILDPRSGAQVPFLEWADRLPDRHERSLSELQVSAQDLVARLRLYQAHRMGLGLKMMPVADDPLVDWVSEAQLRSAPFNDQTDPSDALRKAQQQLTQLHAAYRNRSSSRFNSSAAEFMACVAKSGPQQGPYPARVWIDLELAYNNWMPFRVAWLLTLCTLVLMTLDRSTRRHHLYGFGVAVFVAGLLAALAGLLLRVAISGRAPVTNMYESVVFAAFGVGVFGLLLELKWRRGFIISAAAVIVTLALILADSCPVALDPGIRPLQPALRSNFWLVLHVLTTTLGYSAFALSLGIGNITLGYFMVRSEKWDTIDALGNVNRTCLRMGTVLLAVGTVTGGIWADYSWGRFWGWDPKEVWALVTLLGYLAILHARYVHWVGRFGLASSSVICFSLVVIAWYGVNFVLGSGLHSYGGGQGGQGYVIGTLFVQFLYVATAAVRGAGHTHVPQQTDI